MKSYNNLFGPMLNRDYMKKCFEDAARKKKKRKNVRATLDNIDMEADILCYILDNGLFIPAKHTPKIIVDNGSKKERKIVKPDYRYEQVVHHMVVGKFKPIVLNGLYEFSYGSVPKRGVHAGMKVMKKWIRSYKGKKFYVLKMDIRHFFDSIDRTILKGMLRKVIRDARFLRLMCIIVESDRIGEIFRIIKDYNVDISDDETRNLLSALAFDDKDKAIDILRNIMPTRDLYIRTASKVLKRYIGIPIGFFASPWLCVFYIKSLDHYIKQELHAEHHMRYVDDMVILGRSKKKLHWMRKKIEEYLKNKLHLTLKGNWQVFRFEYPVIKDKKPVLDQKGKIKTRGRMLDFMGFQFHFDMTTIRKRILKATRAKALRMRKSKRLTWYSATQMLSRLSSFKHTDCHGYFLKYIKPAINVKELKRLVSKHQRKENANERLESCAKYRAA